MANDNNGYLKGSKWNPYTHNEFQGLWGTDNWHGGWFENNGLKYGSGLVCSLHTAKWQVKQGKKYFI